MTERPNGSTRLPLQLDPAPRDPKESHRSSTPSTYATRPPLPDGVMQPMVIAPPSLLGNVACEELFGGREEFGHKIRTALFIGTVGDCRRSTELPGSTVPKSRSVSEICWLSLRFLPERTRTSASRGPAISRKLWSRLSAARSPTWRVLRPPRCVRGCYRRHVRSAPENQTFLALKSSRLKVTSSSFFNRC